MPGTTAVEWVDTALTPSPGTPGPVTPRELSERVITHGTLVQAAARKSIVPERQRRLGQYFTPIWVARLMASMVPNTDEPLRLLDPGAGAGTLFTALAAHCLRQDSPPQKLTVTAYEIDDEFRPFLRRSADIVASACRSRSIPCEVNLRFEDFAELTSLETLGHLFSEPETFDAAILNPPYGKLSSDSDLRARLDALGIAAPNLYAAFLGLALRVVRPGGTVVAIVPRSFCNGTYFGRFRRYLLRAASVRHVHLFARRDKAFSEDAVLQENVVLALRRGTERRDFVSLSFSDGVEDDPVWSRRTRITDVVRRNDADLFVHIPDGDWSIGLSRTMDSLPSDVGGLGIDVSTGPVVGFRMRRWFREPDSQHAAAPLLHPANLRELTVNWPVEGKKAQAMERTPETERVLVPKGWYVATRRFTSKEEPRRVVASVIDPSRLPGDRIALENHLNYFHRSGAPLTRDFAVGLATYLNTTFVDRYFRQFSGHTQVNATDLRKLGYPRTASLEAVGASLESVLVGEPADRAVRQHCKELCQVPESDQVQARIDEALAVLSDLGMPREQLNERSALTLLAIVGVTPADAWATASAPLMGVTPIMDWIEAHYGRKYAPNTRETIRRFTLHQFVDAALAVPNPDRPDRPVNSPQFCYQIESTALSLLRTFGSDQWQSSLAEYRTRQDALKVKYAQRREMAKIPLVIKEGLSIALTPGGQNELVRLVVEEFCPRFIPGGEPVYIGDAGDKWAYLDDPLATELGIDVDEHGKMPDVVVFDRERDWLVLIEAVTSHGPVDPKRIGELRELFADVKSGLVFVTAFLDRRTFVRYLSQIAWQTEVWIAESPGHLVHFDGERFLGPYDSPEL